MPDELNVTILVRGRDLPGIEFCDREGKPIAPVHVGIQRGREVIDAVPGDSREVVFRPAFRVGSRPDGVPNFLGPFAQGTPADRFFYLSWGIASDRGFEMFRRLKIRLDHLTWAQLRAADRSGDPIEVRLSLTDARGGPLCATPPPTHIEWVPGSATLPVGEPDTRQTERPATG